MRSSTAVILAVTLVVGCRCDRGGSLAGRYAELVVVQLGKGSAEQLVREAEVKVPAAVMGEHSSGAFTVRNIGDARLTLTKISLADGSPAFTVELPEVTVLEPAQEVAFAVTFNPEQASDATLTSVGHEATFLLESTGGRDGETTATIRVVAEALARDCYLPARLDFGEAPLNQTVWIPVSLSNATPAAATASVSAIGGANPGFFSVDPPGPSIDVPPQTMSSVQVRFSPLTEDAVEAQVRIRRRASCPEAIVTLVGRGSTQAIAWTPSEINFGRVPLNDVATRVVTLTNRSGATLPLSIVAEGTDFRTPTAMGSLPARSTAQVEIGCAPTSLAALTGTLRIDVGTSPLLPIRVGLRCSGGGPRLRITPNPLTFGAIPFAVDSAGRPAPPQLRPEVHRRLRLENVGTPPTPPGDTSFHLVLGRDGRPPFMSLTPLGTTAASEVQVGLVAFPDGGIPALAGKNTIDADVRIRPISVGLKEALLTVYSNDAVQPTQIVRITANATESRVCSISHTPASLSFGDVAPDRSTSLTLTITNDSSEACLLAGLEIAPGSHPGFSLAPSTQSSVLLGAGVSFPVQVQFSSMGLTSGTTAAGSVRFSRPGVADPIVVPLGARVSRCLVATPDELDFGNVKVGCRSAPRTVQIFNTCGTAIRLDAVRVMGSPFTISSAPTSLTIAPSQSTPYAVVFGPVVSPGTFLATLRITDETRATIDVPLKGVGDLTGITTESWTQPTQPASDILFTIDNSCSMADEQLGLAMNFSSFIRYAQSSNIDYRIAVTTTDDFSTTGHGAFVSGTPLVLDRTTPNVDQVFAQRVNVGTTGSGIEQPLSCTLKALSEPLISGQNAGFLRDDANLAIIIVSDAPAQALDPIDYYLNRIPLVKGVRRMHQVSVSVIGPFQAASPTCNVEGPDDGSYQALISRTGGVRANICTTNWATELEGLGRSALGPRSSFFVKNPPDTGQPIDVRIDGQSVSNAWQYDPNANAIVFQSGQAPSAGTTLTVTYQSQCL